MPNLLPMIFLDDIIPLLTRLLAAALIGYLLGSIPFAYFVARLKGVDIFATGSRRAGTANVFWHVGRRRGMLVFSADAAKGAVAVIVSWMLGDAHLLLGITAGAAAIAGHWKSLFTGFKGGDGMVVLVGVSLAYLSWYILVGIAVGIVSVLLFRRSVFRSSIGIFLAYGVMLALNTLHGADWSVMFGLTTLAMVVITHNVLTNADHRPETTLATVDPDLLIEDRPEVLDEAARLSEEAILREVIPQDEGDAKRPSGLGN